MRLVADASDFEDAGIAWYTTAEILKRLDEA